MAINNNNKIYGQNDVVEHYATATGLMPPERYLLRKYVQPHSDILDIGVGGGRTTPYLASNAKSYLGIDYSQAMVDACKQRFPDQDFAWGDATDLSSIADDHFDFTLFSFNGIDSIPSDEGRIAALREIRRVTRPGGHIMISSHNARQLMFFPQLEGAGLLRGAWRVVYGLARSPQIAWRNISSGVFGKGAGYISDPVHGGLFNHASTPASIARDCAEAGLEIVEQVGAHHPLKLPTFFNNWTTYLLKRV